MKSYLLYGKKDLRYCDIPYPNDTSDDEVIVRIKSVGICGSDIHYYNDGKIGDFIPQEPFALGHELAGIIEKESPLNPTLKKGTRVGINPSRPCKTCWYCMEGKQNLCPKMMYIGSASIFPHLNGGFSEYIKIPAENCIPLKDFISFEMAALLEPLSVVLHALSVAGDLKGKSVLVTGAGTIGQLCLMAAGLYTSEPIVITDIRTPALKKAKENGATAALNPQESGFEKEITALAPNGYDILLEASGAGTILNTMVKFMKKGSKILQLGMLQDNAPFPFVTFMKHELTFQSSFRFNNEYALAIALLEKQKIDLTKIITNRFPFDKIPEAMTTASNSLNDIKIIVEN
ncbi:MULTISPECIES: alcohol dehydrogenase catalytic domain-containing protein [unclassified Arenibacter]|uniref:alcohol dehydrogenase catalytic domain-containing protein n=1 Tax=unclassified Arenibacter TaxID=2615047 RepID=UPI000E34436C|nr:MULTISPECIES: alcohol dehydrogenase catalytic domain-containing protein [unclassified Arenibacter]MCM4164705.1 L-idonate 5-dehydrogenase [Arenibacter sp. A80]RFT55780.1 L-idonate 5-dehydrogenase [Arenibacter sp. P308M17]